MLIPPYSRYEGQRVWYWGIHQAFECEEPVWVHTNQRRLQQGYAQEDEHGDEEEVLEDVGWAYVHERLHQRQPDSEGDVQC